MRRVAAAVAGVGAYPLALAMLEDVIDLLASMQEVDAALVVPIGAPAEVRALVWPAMPIVEIAPGATVATAMSAIADADEVALVCPDAPDLPAMLLGKLHSALTAAEVAVCPDESGGLVAVAARLPVPAWLTDSGVRLDDADAIARLQALAPTRRALNVGPGWHRIATAADLHKLDPGLEGWDATRALLGR